MKKVLTILAILVVLTSAVFAETHKLKIQATSTEVKPVFQMTIGNVTTNTNNEFFEENEVNKSLVQEEIAKSFTFEEGGKVKVVVTIQNAAKTKTNYLLAFGGGVFAVNKNGKAKDAENNDYTVEPTIATTEASGTGYASANQSTVGEVKVDFNGTKCTAGSTLCTATYTYGADQTIDPGTYTADIELVITTTN